MLIYEVLALDIIRLLTKLDTLQVIVLLLSFMLCGFCNIR